MTFTTRKSGTGKEGFGENCVLAKLKATKQQKSSTSSLCLCRKENESLTKTFGKDMSSKGYAVSSFSKHIDTKLLYLTRKIRWNKHIPKKISMYSYYKK